MGVLHRVGGDGMTIKGFLALAVAPLAVSTSVFAQQQSAYPPTGSYQQPPYIQPTQPGGYQAPPPASYPQSQAPYQGQTTAPSYQQPPSSYSPSQSAPAYQQQPSVSYQAPQPAAAYPPSTNPQGAYPQQPAAGYQQPPANYRTQPPAGYAPQPASGYGQTPSNYQQAPAGYTPQPQAGYPAPASSGYPQPQGAPGSQPLNYQQQLATYPQSPGTAQAQAWSEEQIDPHHKHHDARHNHNHTYPDRGTVIRNLPAGATVVNYGGQSYWFSEGIWFEPHGAAYTVIEPPIGLVVNAIPPFATAVVGSAGLYFYANDTYYRPRPDLGGYEVVNDPVDSSPAGSAGNVPSPMPAPGFAPPPPATASVYAPAAATAAMVAPVAAAAAAPAPLATPASATLPSRPAQMVSLTPNNGQTPEQQARDRYDCYRYALGQSGYDPLHPKGGVPTAQSSEQEATYDRVRTACLQQRGYTVQ